MPPRARRRAIQPGRRMASDVDELGEDLVDMDIITYSTPPIAMTTRYAMTRPPGGASNSRAITSATAQSSRQTSMRRHPDKTSGHRPDDAFQQRSQRVPSPPIKSLQAS